MTAVHQSQLTWLLLRYWNTQLVQLVFWGSWQLRLVALPFFCTTSMVEQLQEARSSVSSSSGVMVRLEPSPPSHLLLVVSASDVSCRR